jgi:hypothetical protein
MRLRKFYYRSVTVSQIGIKNLVSKFKCIDLVRFFVTDFDNASDYAALAKALYQIAPYEDLIMDGKLVDIPVNGVNTTAIVKGNEMLLLVGNYQRPDIKVNVKLPFNKVTLIKDIRDNEKFKLNNTVTLKIPRSNIRLLYVKGQ